MDRMHSVSSSVTHKNANASSFSKYTTLNGFHLEALLVANEFPFIEFQLGLD